MPTQWQPRLGIAAQSAQYRLPDHQQRTDQGIDQEITPARGRETHQGRQRQGQCNRHAGGADHQAQGVLLLQRTGCTEVHRGNPTRLQRRLPGHPDRLHRALFRHHHQAYTGTETRIARARILHVATDLPITVENHHFAGKDVEHPHALWRAGPAAVGSGYFYRRAHARQRLGAAGTQGGLFIRRGTGNQEVMIDQQWLGGAQQRPQAEERRQQQEHGPSTPHPPSNCPSPFCHDLPFRVPRRGQRALSQYPAASST